MIPGVTENAIGTQWRAGLSPCFHVGQIVGVDDRQGVGHCRAPHYLRGQSGQIVEYLGTFKDPERLAYHKPGYPFLHLYKVRFKQQTIWADYSGVAGDDLEADIYENWLVDAPKIQS